MLERELEDLRVQLRQSSSLNETQELKRTVERKENEKKQLVLQIEVCVHVSRLPLLCFLNCS